MSERFILLVAKFMGYPGNLNAAWVPLFTSPCVERYDKRLVEGQKFVPGTQDSFVCYLSSCFESHGNSSELYSPRNLRSPECHLPSTGFSYALFPYGARLNFAPNRMDYFSSAFRRWCFSMHEEQKALIAT
jgi:hypothetical protein